MDTHNRFAVPIDRLDAVRVVQDDQVQEQAEPRSPESSQWSGALVVPRAADGGGPACAGDGD